MNLFGVGPLEILLVAVIAVVVLGPERFPQAAVHFARAVKFLRGYANDATSELRAEFQELTREYEEMRKELDEVRTSVSGVVKTATGEIDKATGEMGKVITETKALTDRGSLNRLLQGTEPIIEPGGDLPPDRTITSDPPKNGGSEPPAAG